MPAAAATRFAARPVAMLTGEIADALAWPRSRPARLLSGERAATIGRFVICVDEESLVSLEAPADTAVLLATPPSTSDGRLGRRVYDPFAGTADDIASWRRAERVVLDASLLLAGGRGGIDERLAARMGLVPLAGHAALLPARAVRMDAHKLVLYVPVPDAERVRDAVFAAGAGQIGSYDMCSWSTAGVGSFRGGEETNPAVGTRGEFEQIAEQRIEVVVASHLLPAVLRAYEAAHPYEVAASDVIALDLVAPVGFGRVGALGEGGGSAAWSALGEIDPELAAYGRVDHVSAGATCIVYSGPARDLLDALLGEPKLGLVVVAGASDAELELCAERDIAVLVISRTCAVQACASELAGALTRALTLPVTVAGPLSFPADQTRAADATAADPAAAVFSDTAAATGDADYATGTWRIHFDGGSRGNPGPAAYGWVLFDPSGAEHESDGVRIGTATNNVAEWTGLLSGLEHALARGIKTLSIRGDSELVVKQVTGVYKVKNAALKPLAEQVAALLKRFDHVDVKHVYRADNARADAVANEAMDGLR